MDFACLELHSVCDKRNLACHEVSLPHGKISLSRDKDGLPSDQKGLLGAGTHDVEDGRFLEGVVGASQPCILKFHLHTDRGQLIGAELIALITEQCFDDLDARPVRLSSQDIPTPYNGKLENLTIIQPHQIVGAAKQLKAGSL